MFALLIPFLTLLAGVSKAEDVPDFSKTIQVKFTWPDWQLSAKNLSWVDRTLYDPPDVDHKLSNLMHVIQSDGDNAVAFMNFTSPNDKETARRFEWTLEKASPTVKSCEVWLEEEPEVTTLEYNMFEDTFGPTLEDTKSLKVYCKTAQQSAAVAPSNGLTTTVSGPSSSYSAFIPDVTPIVEESDHKLKEGLLINFLTELENLIDMEHRWWIDTTEYEGIRDGSWEPFDQPAMAITHADASTEPQFKLGSMKYKGHSDVDRTFEWTPKPDEGAEQVVKHCRLSLKNDQDPGVPEVRIWVESLWIQPRRDGQDLDAAETKKFQDDKIIEVHCD